MHFNFFRGFKIAGFRLNSPGFLNKNMHISPSIANFRLPILDYKHFRLMVEVVIGHGKKKIKELNQNLTEKWDHVISLQAFFNG